MDIQGINHERYEHSDKYRADIFKLAGATMLTPFCATVFALLTKNPFTLFNQPSFWAQLSISGVLAVLGFILIFKGFEAMVKLDMRVSS